MKINSYKDDNNFLTFDLYKLNYLYKKLLSESIKKMVYNFAYIGFNNR